MTPRLRARPLERLADADPAWVDSSGGRRGVMLQFECPIHESDAHGDTCRIAVPLDPPLDGGAPIERGWRRSGGEDFDSVTLAPSIRRLGESDGTGCRWHGFVRGGRFETCGDSR